MNTNSLADQLGWCITTKDHLNNLNNEMLYVKNQYQNMVTNLRSSGYMKDLLPMIENMHSEFGSEINALVKYIQDEHLAYIQVQADATASTINTLLNQ
ncbi:hypothetical protein [Alishewanella longhuensis]